jgi:hypothetical protein
MFDLPTEAVTAQPEAALATKKAAAQAMGKP